MKGEHGSGWEMHDLRRSQSRSPPSEKNLRGSQTVGVAEVQRQASSKVKAVGPKAWDGHGHLLEVTSLEESQKHGT